MGSIIGTVKRVGQTTTKGNYQFRELVLNTKEQYPQILSIIFSNDKCIVLDKYNEGDHVEIQYNLRGREWTNPKGEVKVFNTNKQRVSKLKNTLLTEQIYHFKHRGLTTPFFYITLPNANKF